MRENAGRETLKILPNGVTINIVNSGALPEPETFLSPAEIEKYNSFKIPKRKADWLGGRYAVKTLLAAELRREDLVNIEISYDHYDRPRAAGQIISISHSGGLALAAVKPGAGEFIGTDIEMIEERCGAWYADYFAPGELNGNDPSEATKLWTIKEAALKALGLGLKADLRDARFNNGTVRFHGAALERYRTLGSPAFAVSSFLFKDSFWVTTVAA
ncbi:MAG: 4'-phosphopantetheinyl transferase superfamily protein [Elusimicrobia bacterium]|nr:4'-phosphopantetheinyl transferase superfamily protein [Elusimicrobiota bacterium]